MVQKHATFDKNFQGVTLLVASMEEFYWRVAAAQRTM